MATKNNTKNKGKRNNSNEWLINLFLVLLAVTVIVLVLVYLTGKKKPQDEDQIPTPTPAATPTTVVLPGPSPTGEQGQEPPTGADEPSPTEQGGQERPTIADDPFPTKPSSQDDNVTPQPDEPSELTPEPSPSPTQDITPTQEAGDSETEPPVSMEEADKMIQDVFWEAGEDFRVVLSDNDLTLDGDEYYCYTVYYRDKAEDYSILVAKKNGRMYYYEDGVRTDYDGILREPESEQMTEERAQELLSDISAESLMLPASLGECSLSLDNWKTVVYGSDCYCLNVFYNGALAGNIYFTETADIVYYLDEFGEFVKVK